VQKLGLECQPSYKIGLIGAAFFAGWTSSVLWMPRLADTYGRATVIRGSLIPTCFIIGTIIITDNLNAIISLLFVLGIFTSGVMTVGYVTVMEFIPIRMQSKATGAIWTFYGGIFAVLTVYFQLSESKNWDWINLVALF